jgi:hypothetical protein
VPLWHLSQTYLLLRLCQQLLAQPPCGMRGSIPATLTCFTGCPPSMGGDHSPRRPRENQPSVNQDGMIAMASWGAAAAAAWVAGSSGSNRGGQAGQSAGQYMQANPGEYQQAVMRCKSSPAQHRRSIRPALCKASLATAAYT